MVQSSGQIDAAPGVRSYPMKWVALSAYIGQCTYVHPVSSQLAVAPFLYLSLAWAEPRMVGMMVVPARQGGRGCPKQGIAGSHLKGYVCVALQCFIPE